MKRNGQGLFIRLAVLLLAVLLVPVLAYNGLAAQETAVTDPECYEHGDVNGDGVVDSRDAVQILYHSIFDDDTEMYPVNQDCDFDGDGKVDREDALYILYGSFQLSQYPLDGEIHLFYEPEWKWDTEGAVEVTFKCGCGQTHSFDKTTGVTVTSEKTAQENCLSAGLVVYTATVSFGDKDHTDTYEVVIPATGHQMTGTQSCNEGSACANCDYSVVALGHNWVSDTENSKAATCTANAVEAFKCDACGETKRNTVEGSMISHTFEKVAGDVEISECVKAELYKCGACGEEVQGEQYTTHTYVASIQNEATCVSEGTKLYTCKFCPDSYTETIPANGFHSWDAGVTEDNITTFACTADGCGATKTAVVADGERATVSKETLQDTEVQVNNAAIKLDQETLEALGEEVEIGVAVVDTADVELDDELKEQIGSNPVYDFSLTSGETQISEFAGEITISLPYTLQEGDDVDCIDVWFINDAGEVECVMGTYSNGQVTFTTNHFSYYTVTRLTPKQRCEHYGHLYNYSYKAPTCTANGYDIQTCKRCGHVEKNDILAMVPHKFIETVQKATCTEDGYTSKKCPVCKLTVSGVLPTLGHNWEKDESRSRDADCHAAGYETFVCGNCDQSYRNDLAQLEHIYESELVPPGCTTHGHKKDRCILCGDKKEKNTDAPTGHDFTAENARWEWAEDCSSATVTLVCAYDEGHTKTLNAVVGRELGDGKTCSSKITYKAVASFNKAEFSATKEVDMGYVQHTPGTELLHDADGHYYQCQICKGKVGFAKHTWGEGKVLSDPTCVKTGLKEFACTSCDAKRQEEILATGEHVYADGVCTGCGLVENTCTHSPLSHIIAIDNAKWGICEDTIIEFRTCDCGEYTGFVRREGCVSKHMGTETVVTNLGEFALDVYQCIYCGLTHKTGHYEEIDPENCITTWYEIYALYMEDTLIAIDYNLMVPDGQPVHNEHMMNHMREIDLAEYGMCGDVLVENHCYCGESTHTYVEETRCNWEYQATDDGNIEKSTCSVCGATRTNVFNSVEDGCWYHNSRTYTYELDGEEVYSFTTAWDINICDYAIETVEYINGSCENGAMVLNKCQNCGDSYWETYHGSHPYIYQESILVEGDGICYNRAYRSSCGCGESANIDYSTGCYFFLMESNNDGKYQRYECTTCGLNRIVERSYSEKDENCNCYETTKVTYADPEGNVLLELEATNYGEFHDIQNIRKLMEGATTCEDGVSEKEICADCGLVTYENQYYDHWTYPVATYRCADYGMCGDVMVVNSCACGKTSNFSTVEFRCNWEYGYTEETGMYYQCHTCNTTKTYDRYMTGEDGCAQLWTHDTVYTRDGEEVLRINTPYKEFNHRSYFTLELLGQSCEDGYRVTEYCKDCNHQSNWGEFSDSHGMWIVSRDVVSQGKLCGDLEQVTTRCACGQEQRTDMQWFNGSCEYPDGEYYLPALDAFVSKCAKCGIEQLRKETREPGITECETLVTSTYTYRKNGVNMFTHVNRNTEYGHSYLYSFSDMQGSSCYDGYQLKGVCADCGRASSFGTYHSCMGWLTDVQPLELDDASCGDAQIQTFACPCGNNNSSVISESCNFDWQSSENGTTHWKCWNCGLEKYTSYESEIVPNSCQRNSTSTYTYVRDGEEVAKHVSERVHYQHIYVATFEMDGQTCADGYTLTEACVYCGEVGGNGYFSGCENTFTTEVIDLAAYGVCSGTMAKWSCPCGENSSWNLTPTCANRDTPCNYCGTMFAITKELRRDTENCRLGVATVYTFTRDGEEIYTFTDETWESMHDMEVTFSLQNPDAGCEGGYTMSTVCKQCGETETASGTGHDTFATEYLFFDDLDQEVCGSYLVMKECACGENKKVDNSSMICDFWYQGYNSFYDSQGNLCYGDISRCSVCGLETCRYSRSVADTENCKNYNYRITVYRKNEEVLTETTELEYAFDQHSKFVDVQYTLMDGAQSCDGGVIKTATCHCGTVETSHLYHHETRNVEVIDLTQYGLCRGNLVNDACVCGESDNWGVYDCCGGCETCGMTYSEIIGGDREGCAYVQSTTYRIADGENVVFEKATKRITGYNHIYLTTFELLGETCMDGYYYTQVCAFCGEQGDSGYDSSDHSYYKTEIAETPLFSQSSEYHLWKDSCPCGENSRWNLAPYPGEYTRSREVRYDAETCRKITTDIYTFMENGEVIDTITCESGETWHEYVAEFELYDPKAGCEGGYAVTMTCRNCDEAYYNNGYDHDTYVVDYLFVNDLDEELCGGYLYFTECACGQQKSAGEDLACGGWTHIGYEDIPNGHHGYVVYCNHCGVKRSSYSHSVIDEDHCQENYYLKTIYFKDGNVVMEYDSLNYSNEYHINDTTFKLFDEAVGCDAGYEVTNTCRVCGKSESWTDTGHCAYTVDYLFLDQAEGDLCGGFIEKLTCPCGWIQDLNFDNASCSFSWTTEEKLTDPQGNSYGVAVYTCEKCGLERCDGYYYVIDRENCTEYGYNREFCRLGEEILIESVGTNGYWDYHTYDDGQYTLVEGATSCEQGVVEIKTCQYCDYSQTSTNYYHTPVPVETVDLQQYGAVCDTQFVRKQCACSQRYSTEFVGEDVCDMQQEWTESWITDAVCDGQETTEGYVWLGNDAWCYTCAVTNPQCAFKVRNARYYKVENCVATQYETWQFGYNPEDGSCAYEFTFATGEQHAFHDYAYTYEQQQIDETNYADVHTYVCTACKSTYTQNNTYVNGYHFSSDSVAVNTLKNGEKQYNRNYYEYGIYHKNYAYASVCLYEYTNADGSEYWYRYDYTYDFTEGCNRVCKYTNINGDNHSTDETCHVICWESNTNKNATCTQFGEYTERWFCDACGWIESENTVQSPPNNHYWYGTPDGDGYVCDTCGLQNANGASGSIVMEDMTNAYGENINYVVGYWNQEDLSVHKYVSVVLKDAAEGAEDELILDGIAFTELSTDTDGINAITFSQADAAAAALAAMEEAGYTGDYAIRFTFVPTNAGDTLDYAITFDSLSA